MERRAEHPRSGNSFVTLAHTEPCELTVGPAMNPYTANVATNGPGGDRTHDLGLKSRYSSAHQRRPALIFKHLGDSPSARDGDKRGGLSPLSSPLGL